LLVSYPVFEPANTDPLLVEQTPPDAQSAHLFGSPKSMSLTAFSEITEFANAGIIAIDLT
jgi:hypothetical protein